MMSSMGKVVVRSGWVGVLVGLVLCGQAGAIEPPPKSDFRWPIEPSTGMYFDGTQSGTGLGVDLFPVNGQNFFFGAFYHYDPNGAPTWFTFQSFLQTSSVAAWLETGVVASVSGPWIRSQGGQCFDCAYTAPTTSATPFERTLHVLGARQLYMPASGNAAALTLTRTDAVIASGNLIGQATLTSNTVYAVSIAGSSGQVFRSGWVQFRPRPASDVHNLFSGFVAEPGATPNRIEPPAWMVLHGDPNTLPQYEANCVRNDFSAGGVGTCDDHSGLAESTQDIHRNQITFFVDPVTDRIRVYKRCTSNFGIAICNQNHANHVVAIGDVIEASPPRPGAPPRLITRTLSLIAGAFNAETEFSPVSPEDLAAFFPGGVPAP